MLNKLYSLQRYLNRLSLTKEAIFLDTLIKQAYQEGSFFIEYDDGDPFTVEADLKVIKNGREETLAFAFASKLGQKVEAHKELIDDLGFEPTGWWHIHAPGFTSYEAINRYGRLGYGQQLYLVLIKYITEVGGVVISAPIDGTWVTSDALKVRDKLKGMSEISSIDVALKFGETKISIENLNNIKDEDLRNILLSEDSNDGISTSKKYLTKAQEASKSDEDSSKKSWINVSQGTIFWASGRLPISVDTRSATQVFIEELWEDNRKLESNQTEPNSSEGPAPYP